MHTGDGGTPAYWGGVDQQIMDKFDDHKAIYIDGSVGGVKGLVFNLIPSLRESAGAYFANECAAIILAVLEEGETIKYVTHSMGAAYAKGFIKGMSAFGEKNGIDVLSKTDFELDIAPFQPMKQEACDGVPTFVLQNQFDCIALPFEMEGAICKIKDKKIFKPFYEHKITSYGKHIEIIDDIFPFLSNFTNGNKR